jgi:antitoxin HicB
VSERLHYSMVVQWSDDDQAYLVTLPEWDGRAFNPVTHGDTYEDAVKRGHEALAALVAAARKHGEPLPEPRRFACARWHSPAQSTNSGSRCAGG